MLALIVALTVPSSTLSVVGAAPATARLWTVYVRGVPLESRSKVTLP